MMRREFVRAVAGSATVTRVSLRDGLAVAPTSRATWRDRFPALSQRINGHPLIYLDTAATALRPEPVIDALARFYGTINANPGAALHTLARRANAALEEARATVASFIGAADPLEVIFTRGTTEGLNLVASTWGLANLRAGDEILIGIAEHASNLLPWRYLAHRVGARLVHFDIDDNGHVRLDDLTSKLSARTRIVAFSHVSNVLGMLNPAREIVAAARGPGRIVVIDGAQSVPHFPVHVNDLGCDFLAFSSHKMGGRMGVGVLWGRRELLEAMPPYQAGSNMAHDVDLDGEHLAEGALKFSAGTPNVSGPVGLAAAIDFLQPISDALGALPDVDHPEPRFPIHDPLGQIERVDVIPFRPNVGGDRGHRSGRPPCRRCRRQSRTPLNALGENHHHEANERDHRDDDPYRPMDIVGKPGPGPRDVHRQAAKVRPHPHRDQRAKEQPADHRPPAPVPGPDRHAGGPRTEGREREPGSEHDCSYELREQVRLGNGHPGQVEPPQLGGPEGA